MKCVRLLKIPAMLILIVSMFLSKKSIFSVTEKCHEIIWLIKKYYKKKRFSDLPTLFFLGMKPETNIFFFYALYYFYQEMLGLPPWNGQWNTGSLCYQRFKTFFVLLPYSYLFWIIHMSLVYHSMYQSNYISLYWNKYCSNQYEPLIHNNCKNKIATLWRCL